MGANAKGPYHGCIPVRPWHLIDDPGGSQCWGHLLLCGALPPCVMQRHLLLALAMLVRSMMREARDRGHTSAASTKSIPKDYVFLRRRNLGEPEGCLINLDFGLKVECRVAVCVWLKRVSKGPEGVGAQYGAHPVVGALCTCVNVKTGRTQQNPHP